MENYRVVLKKRYLLMILVNVLIIASILVIWLSTNKTTTSAGDLNSTVKGFQVGLFVSIQVIMIRIIIQYKSALSNDTFLKKIYVRENDERSKLIYKSIGGFGFNLSLGLLAAATVISGFLNQEIFITLAIVLILQAFIKGSLKTYYNNKY